MLFIQFIQLEIVKYLRYSNMNLIGGINGLMNPPAGGGHYHLLRTVSIMYGTFVNGTMHKIKNNTWYKDACIPFVPSADGVSNHLPHDCSLNRLFKENIKAPRHLPLCGEFTGDRWNPHKRGQ